jgi:hypothetical protein
VTLKTSNFGGNRLTFNLQDKSGNIVASSAEAERLGKANLTLSKNVSDQVKDIAANYQGLRLLD